jgi:predicted  nucleic acid-binding Zn-ribbon protein
MSGLGYPPYDWRIDAIERTANAAAPAHEVSALRGTVDRLEYSLREIRAEVDGLRSQLSNVKDSVIPLLQQEIERLSQPENA